MSTLSEDRRDTRASADARRPVAVIPYVVMRSTIGEEDERAMVRHLAAYVAGSVGQGMPFVVIAVEFTRRGLPDVWLAAVATARILPYVVCSPVAGALAGRCRLGRLVTVSAAARVGLAVLVLSFLQESPPWAALAVLVLIGVAGTPCYPALMAGLRSTVAERRQERWGRHLVLCESVAFATGPALAGALVVVDGSGRTALVVSITLFAVSTAIALRADPLGSVRPGHGARSYLRPALGALANPKLRSGVAALLVVNVLGGAAMALLPAIARELRPQDGGLLGWLTAVQGIGALLVVAGGSAVVMAVGRRPVRMGIFAACGSLLGLAAAGRPVLAVASCAVFGGAVVMVEAAGSVEVLQRLPATTVGAAFGILDSLLIAAMVTGGLAGPLLATIAGTRWALAFLAITAAIWVLQGPRPLRSRQVVPSAGGPPELRDAIIEGEPCGAQRPRRWLLRPIIRSPEIPIRVVPGVGRAFQRGPPPSGREPRPISGGAAVACTSCVASLGCPAPRTRHRLAIGERLIAEPVHVAPHPRIGNERQPGQQTPVARIAETRLMLPQSYVRSHRQAHRAGVPRADSANRVRPIQRKP